MHSLEILAKTTKKSVTEIMEPHKDVLQDMIPPKKHLLRHQPANAQIGLMVCHKILCKKNINHLNSAGYLFKGTCLSLLIQD